MHRPCCRHAGENRHQNYLQFTGLLRDFELERGVMRGLKTKVFVILFLTVLTLSENVVVVHAASAHAKTIVSFAGINPRQSPLWIAQEQGFFSKNGVDVDLIFIRTGPIQVAAVSAGSTQIAYAATKIQNPLVANLKVEEVIDNRPLKKLEESGFLQRTYSAYGVK